MNLLKRIVTITTVFAVLFGMTSPAQAATIAELEAQIAALLAQLTTLQAQLTALGGGTGGVTGCTITSFATNLSQGMSGADVKCLQIILNSDPATQLAASGVGSPGQETEYFGPLTFAAVIKFQEKYASEILATYGLTTGTGYVGTTTRAKLNTLLTVIPPTTCGNGTCDVGETNATCPADCPVTTCGNAVCDTGESFATCPADCPVSGGEGSITGTISASPASGVQLTIGEADVAVGAMDVKATDSDVMLNRLDLNFNVRPWLYISSVTVSDGTTSKTVEVTEANTTVITVGSNYLVRIDGLSMNTPEDTTKKITVKVTGAAALPAGTTSQAVTLTFNTNALRGTDGAGISQYAPTAALATRIFTVKTGDTATIEASSNTDSPLARTIQVSTTANTEGIVLLKHNLTAKNNSARMTTVRFTLTAASNSATLNTVFPTAYLFANDTQLAITSTHATDRIAFDGWGEYMMPKDGLVTLTLKVDADNIESGNYHEGESASATLALADITATDATSYTAVVPTGSAGTGADQHLFSKGLNVALVSQSIVGRTTPDNAGASTTPMIADAEIVLNLTAFGGDIYVPYGPPTSAAAASSGIRMNSNNTSSSTASMGISTTATQGTYGWLVPSGATVAFTANCSIETNESEKLSTHPNWFNGYIQNLRWMTADASYDGEYFDWGLTTFKTGSLQIYPYNY